MDSSSLPVGIYDELMTVELEALIGRLATSLRATSVPVDDAELARRVAGHLAAAVERVLSDADEDRRSILSQSLTADVMRVLATHVPESFDDLLLVEPHAVLASVSPRLPDGSFRDIERPLTSLRDTTVLVNAKGEPSLLRELAAEIPSADRIDIVMAFVRWTGIRDLVEALGRHVRHGGQVRILTTTYTNSTELAALEALVDAGVDVRISYDTSTTRLHAKAWLFHRPRGYSTGYVGSSNLTHSALTPGLEWNVRLSAVRNPEAIARMSAVFETYWAGVDFVPFDRSQFIEQTATPVPSVTILPSTDLFLRPFQEQLLERISLARSQGHHRNLLVAATGTGKTVMAAVDYRRLRVDLQHARLLFVAHRKEILEQSLRTFRHAMLDTAFGELWVGDDRPSAFDHVFASIQSLSSAGVESIEPSHFDVVIVDEFHHAAAPTYTRLLEHLAPRELLGLTATPERADGLDLLRYFDGRIAAELRVWDAIDQQHLVPFSYYGIHDGLDLRDVPFKRGVGYDIAELTNVYTANHVWVAQVIAEVGKRVGDPTTMRALGFCVSVDHARFMSDQFNRYGIAARAVTSSTAPGDRAQALRDLRDGRLAIVFTVDLFNEGVDVPTVDTLLLLRPTESATIFLQQLGRGLRRADGKTVCTVLDFVGLQRHEFRFDLKYRALLGGTRRDLEKQIEQKFPFLPSGCHLELDAVAQDVVLASIRSAVPSNFQRRVQELKSMGDVGLERFLADSGVELEDVYSNNHTWSELRAASGFIRPLPSGRSERQWFRALGRLLHVDDVDRARTYRQLVDEGLPAAPECTERHLREARMLVASMFNSDPPDSIEQALTMLRAEPILQSELMELLDVLEQRVTHLGVPFEPADDVPLTIHARYTRREIQAAFGDHPQHVLPPRWDSGVKWLADSATDLLAFTLDKSSGNFSPSTRYRDYAISRQLIHWESQSTTSLASSTGRRYLTQAEGTTKVMLFARLRGHDRAFWFLGPAHYVSHEGERPIAITWRLDHDLPADLFVEFAAAAVA